MTALQTPVIDYIFYFFTLNLAWFIIFLIIILVIFISVPNRLLIPNKSKFIYIPIVIFIALPTSYFSLKLIFNYDLPVPVSSFYKEGKIIKTNINKVQIKLNAFSHKINNLHSLNLVEAGTLLDDLSVFFEDIDSQIKGTEKIISRWEEFAINAEENTLKNEKIYKDISSLTDDQKEIIRDFITQDSKNHLLIGILASFISGFLMNILAMYIMRRMNLPA